MARARLRIPFTSRFLGGTEGSKALAAQWDSAEPRMERMAGFRAALMAGCFEAPGESVELLLHAELGSPGEAQGPSRAPHLCRLAVRSKLPLVNRAVAQAELLAKSGEPEFVACACCHAMANSVILRNGHILSCKSGPGMAGSIAEHHWLHVEEGRIKGIGCGEPPDIPGIDETIDLEGRTVLPGLADSHLHVFALGKATTSVNLEGCNSIDELQSRTRQHLEETAATGGSHFLEGLGWDQDLLGRTPTRCDLDVVPMPAVFYRRCHHVAVLNSAALKACSIHKQTEETPPRAMTSGYILCPEDVEGGVIERENGEPTGVLREKALELLKPLTDHEERTVLQLVDQGPKLLGSPLQPLLQRWQEPFDAQKDILLRGLRLCVELLGARAFLQIGSVQAAGWPIEEWSHFRSVQRQQAVRPWEAYSSLASESKLPCRVFLTVAWQDVGAGAPAAKKAMNHCKDNGFRVEAHAIGDRAATDLVDAFEKFMPSTERPVLTHCQFLNKSLVERMSKGGIIANVQPQFVPSDLPIIKSRVGEGECSCSRDFMTF
eukprot:Skav234794  [mRNA]  locus=scaffold69:152448:159177:+ [translate_table: standard]